MQKQASAECARRVGLTFCQVLVGEAGTEQLDSGYRVFDTLRRFEAAAEVISAALARSGMSRCGGLRTFSFGMDCSSCR